ncbi:MAG: hypothetical protein ABIS27_14950 [Longimicrobiales bacterium]
MNNKRTRSFAALLLVLLVAACASSGTPASSESNRLGATLVVERFLRAANAKDLDTMAELFGTKEGPFNRMGSKKENDDRMFIFATVLKNSASMIKGEGDPVSGRRDEAFNLLVEVTQNQRKTTVPFPMVQYKNGWLIEQFDLEKLTSPR